MARWTIILAIGVCSLAAGCCCPALSGRYYEVGLPPPGVPTTSAAEGEKCATDPRAGLNHNACNRQGPGWFGRGHNDPVPSQQQYDYISPLPKYHPAPTHPVFEAQMHYLPPSDPAAKPQGVQSGKH